MRTKRQKEKLAALPPDPDGMNDERAGWAADTIDTFTQNTGQTLRNALEKAEVVTDLMADLRHWCDRNGVDFRKSLLLAHYHYEKDTGQ